MPSDNISSQDAGILTVFVYRAGTSMLLSCVPIRVSNAANCFTFSACTNERGFADIGPLPNGTYNVCVGCEKQTAEVDGVTKKTLIFNCFFFSCAAPCECEKNLPCTGSVRIRKYFAGDPSQGLPNAVFSMFDLTRNLIATGTTQANGLLTFTNVPCGRYVVFEDTTPPGYVSDNAPRPVTVSENNVSTLSFPNYIAAVPLPEFIQPRAGDPTAFFSEPASGSACPSCGSAV